MSKIISDPEVRRMVDEAKPGNTSVYVNLDAIRELPEEYEVVLTKVVYDPKDLEKNFSAVDTDKTMWMPRPEMVYKIAEAKGVSGAGKSISEPIVEEVDINPMLLKPIDSPPTIRKMIVGRRVVKFSTVIEEDGTSRRSSPCTCEYNVWERCAEMWAKEEMYTDGYKKASKYPNKYETQGKRVLHFRSEMKFAHAKGETKAFEKTVRELASLMTGYKTSDLTSGYMIFAKVRRSALAIKMETAAHLQAIANGQPRGDAPAVALFGPPEPPDRHDAIQFAPPEEPAPAPKSARDEMLAVLEIYVSEKRVPVADQATVDAMVAWLRKNADADTNEAHKTWWEKCAENIKVIEGRIPEVGRISHREF